MLTAQRQGKILDEIAKKRSVTVTELCEVLEASESTVRRDLATLDREGKLKKVHGGAVALTAELISTEPDVQEKLKLYSAEKDAIAKYAASLIEYGDFVYIDAGTTTEKMIDFIPQKDVSFVTNGFTHAKKLAQRGFKVYIPGGEVKFVTEAIIGAECVMTLKSYNFTKCFIGANGISVSAGFSTPDVREARVKTAAIDGSRKAYVLSDHSKFDKITSATFIPLNRATIITDKLLDKKYTEYTSVKEVL